MSTCKDLCLLHMITFFTTNKYNSLPARHTIELDQIIMRIWNQWIPVRFYSRKNTTTTIFTTLFNERILQSFILIHYPFSSISVPARLLSREILARRRLLCCGILVESSLSRSLLSKRRLKPGAMLVVTTCSISWNKNPHYISSNSSKKCNLRWWRGIFLGNQLWNSVSNWWKDHCFLLEMFSLNLFLLRNQWTELNTSFMVIGIDSYCCASKNNFRSIWFYTSKQNLESVMSVCYNVIEKKNQMWQL